MRVALSAFACLFFLSIPSLLLSPQNAEAHEPRVAVSPAFAVERNAETLAVTCDEGQDCGIEEMRGSNAGKRRRLYAPPPNILAAIEEASAATDTDFLYLLKTATLESSFDPTRRVATSSAKGLYQFVEQTWLYMMREHGAEAGLWEFAQAVIYEESGFDVEDEILRTHILSLRDDPELSALFAGAYTQRNAEALARVLGREVEPAELYVAHVLGMSGAAKLIGLARESPEADASKVFGRAAKANRSIFYEGRKPRSAKAVLEVLLDKYFNIPVDTGEAVWRGADEQGISQPVKILGEHEDARA